MTKLLLTLRYNALGTMLLAVGDFVGVSKSSACVIVKEVSIALASLRSLYIHFPQTPEEVENVMVGFYSIAKFPHVIGAVDCTHVRIQSPGNFNILRYLIIFINNEFNHYIGACF